MSAPALGNLGAAQVDIVASLAPLKEGLDAARAQVAEAAQFMANQMAGADMFSATEEGFQAFADQVSSQLGEIRGEFDQTGELISGSLDFSDASDSAREFGDAASASMGQLKQGASGAGEDVKEIGRVISGMTGSLRNLAGLFGIGYGIKEIVGTIVENENALAMLDQRIAATGSIAGFTREQVLGLGEEIERTTGYTRESAIEAAVMASRFDSIGRDIFPQVMHAAVELAAAMNTDLNGAMRTLALLMENPEASPMLLRRANIGFSPEAADELKNATSQLQQQQIVLDQITSEAGGTAEAKFNTLGGALRGLAADAIATVEALGEGREGQGLGPGLKNAATAAGESTPFWEGLATYTGQVLYNMGRIALLPATIPGTLATNLFEGRGTDLRALLTGAPSPDAASGSRTGVPPVTDESLAASIYPAQTQAQIQARDALGKKIDEIVGKSAEEVDANERLAAAYGKGAGAVREITIANTAYQQLQSIQDAAAAAHISLTDSQTAAILRSLEAQERSKLAAEDAKKSADENARGAEQYSAEVEHLDRETIARERLSAAILGGTAAQREAQIQNDIDAAADRLKIDLSAEEYDALVKSVTASDQAKFQEHDLAEEAKLLTSANAELGDSIKGLAADWSETLTPMQRYQEKVAQLHEAYVASQFTGTPMSDAQLQQGLDNLGNQYGQHNDAATRVGASFEAAVNAGGSHFISMLEKIPTESKKGVSGLQELGSAATAMAQDLEKTLLELSILNPIENAIFGGKGGNLLPTIGDLVSRWFGSSPLPDQGEAASNASGEGALGATGKAAAGAGASIFGRYLGSEFGAAPSGTSPLDYGAGGSAPAGHLTEQDLGSGADQAGTGGALGGWFNSAWSDVSTWLQGFAEGGSFDTGGSGGTDSQLVAFRATPGEHVKIGPESDRGPSSGGSGFGNLELHIHPGGADEQPSVQQARTPGGAAIHVTLGNLMRRDVFSNGPGSRAIATRFALTGAPQVQR